MTHNFTFPILIPSISKFLSNYQILYFHEVAKIVDNLGSTLSESTIRNHLKNSKISPESLGINPKKYGLDEARVVYSHATIWNYLENLEAKNIIQLQERDVKSLDDVLEGGYHKTLLEKGGSTGRRVGPISQIDEAEGSWSNVVKYYENQ